MSMVKNEDFKITKGQNVLNLYQFHSKVAKHYFCSNCGIYTHHKRCSDSNSFCYNLGCIEVIDAASIADIRLIDGASMSLIDD